MIIDLPTVSSAAFTDFKRFGLPANGPIIVSTPFLRNISSISAVKWGVSLTLRIKVSAAGLVWLYPSIQLVPMIIRERDTPPTIVRGNI